MVYHGDVVLAHHGQSANKILGAFVIKHAGEYSALTKTVHDTDRAHGHAVDAVGRVLQGRHAAAGRVCVHDIFSGGCGHIHGLGGVAAAQLRADAGLHGFAHEALHLLQSHVVMFLLIVGQAGVLLLLLLGEGADSAAAVRSSDQIVCPQFVEIHQFKLIAGLHGLVHELQAHGKAAAAACAVNGGAIHNVDQFLMGQEFHSYASIHLKTGPPQPAALSESVIAAPAAP